MNVRLWLSTFLMFCSSLVKARDSSAGACNITVDESTPAKQFCRDSLLDGEVLQRLFFQNFTSKVLRPLPRSQLEVELDDEPYGLEGWGNLANDLIDVTSSGSLPYGVILPYLESTVDSPIVSRCGINKTSEGTGDVSISGLFDEFVDWWTPIILVTVLGPVFALIFVIAGTCFCCCRLCGKCHGRKGKYHISNYSNKCSNNKCLYKSYMIIACCLFLLFFGFLFATVSYSQVQPIRDFDGTINSAIDNITRFVEYMQNEVNITISRFDEVNAFLECEINNAHNFIGGNVIETFEPAVRTLIDASLLLASQLNASIDALVEVNTTVIKLGALTKTLQLELYDIATQTIALRTMCLATPGALPAVCDMIIPNASYTVVVNYSNVDDVSTILTALQQVDDIKSQALQAKDSFYAIPCDIRDQISNQMKEILAEVGHFQQIIANINEDVERDLDDIFNEDGFIGDVRMQSNEIQAVIDDYGTPIYTIGILLTILMLLVFFAIGLLVAGLALTTGEYKKHTENRKLLTRLKYGVITLQIMVVVMFGLAVILLLFSSITFFLGASLLRICYSIAENPPNDLPSYELISKVVDNNELWGGYLLGCFLLENSSAALTVTSMLNGCKDNGALYQVAWLDQRYELDIMNMTNISRQIPNLDGLFKDLENEIKFNQDQILTMNATKSLEDFANAGLQEINYTSYIVQTRSMISTLNVSDLIEILSGVRIVFNAADQPTLVVQTNTIIENVQRVNDTTITAIINLTDTLEALILMLNDTASQLNASVDDVIRHANRTFDELQSSTVVNNQTRAVLDRVRAYADGYTNWAIDNLENQIGQCRPLYVIYTNVYYSLCERAVNGINGFWLAIGWCVVLFIPTIIFAIRLTDYFKSMRKMEDSQLNDVENLELRENSRVTSRLENFPLPDYWDEQADGRFCVISVPSYSQEYRNALQNFQKTLPSSRCQIIELRRIQNLDLYQLYSVLKNQMEKNISDRYELERELFHGTSEKAIDQINHQGFNRVHAGKNAAMLGTGTYFAVNANYSFRNTYSPPDKDGYKYIYISLVLTGEYTKGDKDMKKPPPKNPSNEAIVYDSLVDNVHNPTMFVAVRDFQAYPQYLVVCKRKS